MKKKIISQIGASAILLTSLIGTAPASADLPVLPPNANGIDNSGITAILCDNSAHFRLPVPVNTDPDALVPGSGYHSTYIWKVFLGENYLGESDTSYDNFDNGDAAFQVGLGGADVSNGATLTLVGEVNYGEATDSFEIDLDVLDVDFAGGSGTATDPYLVSNADQLSALRCFDDKYFALTNDIDLAGEEWLPIHGPKDDWLGALDGRGHEIKNLSVSGIRQEAGLFGEMQHYTINNLTLRNFNVQSHRDAGALFGEARHGSISNLKILNAIVSGRDDMGLMGGSVDYRSNFNNITVRGDILPYATFSPTYDEGYVESYDIYNVGGLVGYDDADGTNWSNLDVDVDIVVQEPKGYAPNRLFYDYDKIHQQYFGGLVGESGESAAYQDAKVRARITLSNSTTMPSSADKIGGVFGDAEESFADRITAEVLITDKGLGTAYKVGGFVGEYESFVISNSKITSVLDLEVGTESDNSSNKIGGFSGEAGYDNGAHDIKSVSTINIVRVSDSSLYEVGGFNGYDDEGNYRRINSESTITIEDANGSNNSLGVNLESPEISVERIGGFVGRRDDRVSYSGVSSIAKVIIEGAPAKSVGGFMGYSGDGSGVSVRDLISRGSVTVPEASESIAAFAGYVSGPVRFDQVLLSTKLNLTGSNQYLGTIFGEPYDNTEETINRSRFIKSFSNSGLGNPADVEGVPNLGATAKQMKSAKFLKANDFDLVKVFKHTDGQWPTIRVSSPFGSETAVSNIRQGRTNKDTSISVGAVKNDGSRSFFVNLPNANARQAATLFVVRNGKKVKQIHSAALNGVGNWYTTSKYKLRSGDVLRVEINGVKVRTLGL